MPTLLPKSTNADVRREATIIGAWVIGCIVVGALFAAWLAALSP